jgi:hypothetical protein
MPDTRTDDQKAKDIEKTLRYLAEVRLYFEPMIDNIITYVNHGRRRVSDKDLKKGQKTGLEIYDGSAMSALNLLVDGMCGYLCSRNQRWFRFTLPGKLNFPIMPGMRAWAGRRMDEYPDVRQWLQDCEDVQYAALNRSNFYDIITEFLRDGAAPGTAHILAEEDIGAGRIMFTVPHFRECYIAEDQYGHVDTNYRVYKLTLRQLSNKFGYKRMCELDTNFDNAYRDNMHSEREVIHAIYPRTDYSPDREDSRSKRVASIWVLRQGSKLIEESGYDRMPCITWRWRKNSDEWYGRSPAWDAYVDILTANEQGRSNLIAAHKMVEPPMVAPSDLRGQVNVGPKGWTFMDRELTAWMPRPLVTGIQLPFALDAQERTKAIIRDHFAVDFFVALTMASQQGTELTATQVVHMMGEKASVLGTRVGMLQSEALEPIHERVFDIEVAAGRMPMPPPIVQQYAMMTGEKVRVEYLGPLAQAQIHGTKARAIEAGIQMTAQIAQIMPTALDVVDWDATTIDALEAAGFPMNRIRPEQEVANIRQSRLQQMQHQDQVEMMTPMAKLLRAAGPKPEPGSPAQKLLNPEQTEAAPQPAGGA